jgi:hypothetical protein
MSSLLHITIDNEKPAGEVMDVLLRCTFVASAKDNGTYLSYSSDKVGSLWLRAKIEAEVLCNDYRRAYNIHRDMSPQYLYDFLDPDNEGMKLRIYMRILGVWTSITYLFGKHDQVDLGTVLDLEK